MTPLPPVVLPIHVTFPSWFFSRFAKSILTPPYNQMEVPNE